MYRQIDGLIDIRGSESTGRIPSLLRPILEGHNQEKGRHWKDALVGETTPGGAQSEAVKAREGCRGCKVLGETHRGGARIPSLVRPIL